MMYTAAKAVANCAREAAGGADPLDGLSSTDSRLILDVRIVDTTGAGSKSPTRQSRAMATARRARQKNTTKYTNEAPFRLAHQIREMQAALNWLKGMHRRTVGPEPFWIIRLQEGDHKMAIAE